MRFGGRDSQGLKDRQSERRLSQNVVRLYKALSGGWVSQAGENPIELAGH